MSLMPIKTYINVAMTKAEHFLHTCNGLYNTYKHNNNSDGSAFKPNSDMLMMSMSELGLNLPSLLLRVHKNHLKMVQGCRIDTGSCKKPLSKKDSPKTLGTRLSCKTGTGLGGQRARQAGIGLDEHRATHA